MPNPSVFHNYYIIASCLHIARLPAIISLPTVSTSNSARPLIAYSNTCSILCLRIAYIISFAYMTYA